MKAPLSWLQDYIDLPESVDELRDLLTFSGLEVEDVEIHGSTFEGFVVAEITDIAPHPNADRLTLCTVDAGGEDPVTLVCGAPNVKVGLRTIYAPVGSVFPDGQKLKKAKIRGVESLGMLCAEDELGLSDDHSGIMEIDSAHTPGTPAAEVLGGPEVVFDLEVTPNRPDCLSLIGVARELAALTGRDLRIPETPFSLPGTESAPKVKISDPEGCPRYTARTLCGVEVKPSPDWMQKRLRLCGLRPINNVVDITNYVLLETGHPLHAFDLSKICGAELQIRPAADKELLRTLNEEEHKLTSEDLVIADAEKPLALAGVMGGANSEIGESTTTVLLESAAFQASRIRSTARRLDCHTDSSYRFARGCDLTRVDWVSQRAAALLQAHAGVTSASPLVDEYPSPHSPVELEITWEAITGLIGIDIPVDTMRGFFEQLGLEILESDDTRCRVRVPGFRLDLTRPVDLVEEVARLNGLDKIPVRAPQARIVLKANDFETRVAIQVWKHLASRGFLEILNYSLSSPESMQRLDPFSDSNRVALPNPISQDQSMLRSSLLPQMVQTLAFNKAHQTEELALFEAGKVYRQAENGVEEAAHISLGTMGPWRRAELSKQSAVSEREAFLDLKGEVENLLHLLECDEEVTFEAEENPVFAPGQSARLVRNGQTVGGDRAAGSKMETVRQTLRSGRAGRTESQRADAGGASARGHEADSGLPLHFPRCGADCEPRLHAQSGDGGGQCAASEGSGAGAAV